MSTVDWFELVLAETEWWESLLVLRIHRMCHHIWNFQRYHNIRFQFDSWHLFLVWNLCHKLVDHCRLFGFPVLICSHSGRLSHLCCLQLHLLSWLDFAKKVTVIVFIHSYSIILLCEEKTILTVKLEGLSRSCFTTHINLQFWWIKHIYFKGIVGFRIVFVYNESNLMNACRMNAIELNCILLNVWKKPNYFSLPISWGVNSTDKSP